MRPGILRDTRVALLCAGATVSGLGSWLLVVAVPAQVYRLTGSTLATGAALAVEAAPAILVGPWAGALVDRWDRRATLVTADLCAAAAVALILLGTAPHRLGWVYVGLLAENLAVAFHSPAARALLPGLVGTGEALAAANSLWAFSGGVVRLAGPPLGTLLLATGGLGAAVGADVASYLLSAALVGAVRMPRTAPTAGGTAGLRTLARELRDGWRVLLATPPLPGLLVATWAFWTVNATLTALLVPFIVERLGAPGADVGYLVSGLGVGYLVGSAVSRRLVGRLPTRGVLAVAYACVGCCFLAMFHAPTLATATAATACAGVPGAVALVATGYLLQATTPPGVLGRVGAAFYASDATAAVAGGLLAPVLTGAVGLGTALDVCAVAVLAVAAGVAGPWWLPRVGSPV